MKIVRQSDGSWATTPVYVGVGPVQRQCREHRWDDVSEPERVPEEEVMPEGMNYVRMQKCSVCGWQRALLTTEG